jgi:ribosome-associated protein
MKLKTTQVDLKTLKKSLKSDAEVKARYIADIADEKKALDIVTLRLSECSALTDFFVICSVESAPQMLAIAHEVRARLGAFGLQSLAVEGTQESDWMLVDHGDVILHIFKTEARAFYSLERLWADATVLEPRATTPPSRTKKTTTDAQETASVTLPE